MSKYLLLKDSDNKVSKIDYPGYGFPKTVEIHETTKYICDGLALYGIKVNTKRYNKAYHFEHGFDSIALYEAE